MNDPDDLMIERGERYDILRCASLGDWESVKSLIMGISQREQFEPARVLTEARDEAGSNALHYAARTGNQGKYTHPSVLFYPSVY